MGSYQRGRSRQREDSSQRYHGRHQPMAVWASWLPWAGSTLLVRLPTIAKCDVHLICKHSHSAIRLGKVLFPLFALALNLPEAFFDDKVCFLLPSLALSFMPIISDPKFSRNDEAFALPTSNRSSRRAYYWYRFAYRVSYCPSNLLSSLNASSAGRWLVASCVSLL